MRAFVCVCVVSLGVFGFATSTQVNEQLKKAQAEVARGNYLSALHIYRELLKTNRYDTAAMVGLGEAFYALKNYQKALVAFEDAEQILPHDVSVKLWIAKIKLSQGFFDESVNYITQVLELQSRHYDAHILYGDVYARQGIYEKALEMYRTASQINDQNATAYLKLGELFLQQNQPRLALEYLEKAQNIDTQDPVSYYYLGKYYFDQKEYARSEQYLHTALWLNQEYTDAMHVLYQTLFELGHFDKSKKVLLALHQKFPKNMQYLHHLALLSERLGELEEAFSFLFEILEENPVDEVARVFAEQFFHKYSHTQNLHKYADDMTYFWYDLGQAYLTQNLKEPAKFAFIRTIQINPQFWQGRLALAKLYQEEKLFRLSYNELQSLKSHTDNQDIQDHMMFLQRVLRNTLGERTAIHKHRSFDKKPRLALAVFDENHDFEHHYSAEKVFRDMFFTALRMQNNMSVFLLEEQKDKQSEELIARARGADFIIRGKVQEKGTQLHVTLQITNIQYGEKYKTLHVLQQGNARFLDSALYLAERCQGLFPVIGQIIQKNGKHCMINLGKREGLHRGDRLYIFTSKDAFTHITLKGLDQFKKDSEVLRSTLLSFHKNAGLGIEEIEIIEADENIAQAKLLTPDILNEVKLYDYVIKKP